jgi:hypothetical protein
VELTLAEELLLLLVPEEAWTRPARRGTNAALAAAMLVELVEDGGAEVVDGEVSVRGAHPLADLSGGTVEDALSGFGYYRTVLDLLTERGVLTRHWRVFSTEWRLADRERRDALHAEVAAVLTGDAEPTTRTGTLVAMLYALATVRQLFPGPGVRKRAGEVARATWPASELIGAVTAAANAGPEWTPGGGGASPDTPSGD